MIGYAGRVPAADRRRLARGVGRAADHDHPGGPAAEIRACRPDREGWRRRIDTREGTALHEAGHLVVAVAVGRFQNGAAIEMVGDSYRGIAQHAETAPDGALDCPTFEGFDQLQRDFKKATDYAKLAIGMRGWLAYLRTLWLRADAILAGHWLATKMLAMEIQQTECVRRDRAQQILDRWWDAPGNSLLEALTPQMPLCATLRR